MKRVLTFLAIMLLPLSVWAMTPVTDSDLSNVTGQAGVNINADLTMDINIGTMAWGDADGVTGPYDPWTTVGTGGYVGMTGFNIHNLVIRARTDSTDNFNTYSTLMLKPITIDVATGTKESVPGVTFVRFGLGALKISMDQLQFNVALGQRAADPVLNQIMGVVTMGAMSMYINPTSYVDIYAHGAMGVSFDVNVTLDRLTMNYMSWGDTDGLGAGVATSAGQTHKNWMDTGTTAGYVGMNNFNLGDAMHPAVTMNGVVAIDVATAHGGIYSKLPKLANAINNAIMTAGYNYHDFAVGAKGLYYGTRIAALMGSGMSSSDALTAVTTGLLSGSPFCVPMDAPFTPAAMGVTAALAASQAPGYEEPVTVVHISFPGNVGTMFDGGACGFRVNVAKITADIALGDTANFAVGGTSTSPMPAVLGDIYIQGMEMKIKQGSWVDIWAH